MLVVDDEEMVRRLAARMLLAHGYRALEVSGGEAAMRILQRNPQRISAVLTDLAMPGVGGRKLGETVLAAGPTYGCFTCPASPAGGW